ncbi:sterol desaturase family protein [Leptospira langatensis]|uniref:sterol desaturase family protein n=1 Tax=Leptospira langatensis TaxID=2484983 RepID=UPI001FE5390D|nr:sterol desaturase family protein [Leptospira langatensis]
MAILFHLFDPIRSFFAPSFKIYWLYLLSSGIITCFFLLWQKITKKDFRYAEYTDRNLSKKIWLHPSAILDYKYFFVNTILFALYFGYFVLSTTTVSAFVSNHLNSWFGRSDLGSPSGYSFLILYSILFWLANDFGRFLAHLLLHRTFLWEFHKLHHSAEVLNPLTVYRVHPVEGILVNSLGALFSGIVTGIAVFLFPNGIRMITFLGVNAGIFIFNLYANLRHSHIDIRFPKWLSHILLSPAQHQIHHSTDIRLQNKNIGVTFAFWDILSGSLYIPSEEENRNLVFGLNEDEKEKEEFKSLVWIYLLPFKKLLIDAPVKKFFRKPKTR